MPPAPTLSILTPTYNAARFIKGCLENVRDQKCPGIEHLIWDGGSTDETVDIIRNFADKNPYVKWISQKDKGQADAMNKMIKSAQANWIGILNADDFYESAVLNQVCERIQGFEQPSIIIGNCKLLGPDDIVTSINVPQARTLRDLIAGKSFPYNPSAYFYHKSLHNFIGMYDISLPLVLDLDFLMRAFKVAHVIYYDEIFGNYRIIAGTQTFEGMQNGSMWQACDKLRQHYYKDLNFIDRLWVWNVRTWGWITHKLQRLREILS